MPDPIRCSVDPSQPHTVSCEPVRIGPETSDLPAQPEPAPQPNLPPAVTALVQRFPPARNEVHAALVDTFTLDGAAGCFMPISAMAPLLLGLSRPVLGALAGFKVGYDLGVCLAKDSHDRQLSADRDAGVQLCEEQGGAVVGEVDHTLICERLVPVGRP